MAAGTYQIIVQQGETWKKTFEWRQGVGDPVPLVDLTGYHAHLQVRSLAGALLVDLSDGDEITLGGAAGTISITVPHTVTALWPASGGDLRYKYDLHMIEPDGEVVTLLKGNFKVLAGITVDA